MLAKGVTHAQILFYFLYLSLNGIARWFIDIGKEVLFKPTQKKLKYFLENC
jgi:hypothetical protein